MQEVKRKGGTIVGLVNVVGSTIAREVSGGIYLHAGPEVSVASTKVLTHMGVGFAMLAVLLGRVRDLSHSDGARILAGLERIPDQVREILDREAEIGAVADVVADATSVFFIGRVRGYPVAREGEPWLLRPSSLFAFGGLLLGLLHALLAALKLLQRGIGLARDGLVEADGDAARIDAAQVDGRP